MFLRAQRRLETIGVVGEQLTHHGCHLLAEVTGQTDVVLLVDSLQLGMEATDNHVLKTVCLDLCPVLYLIGRNVLDIACNIVRGVSIGSLSTDGRHQLVVLVGDEVLGSQLTDAVNLMVSLATLFRIRQCAILLITSLDIGQQRSLGSSIGDTKLISTLKHQVLQIVRQTCRLGRIVLRACAYSNIGIQTGLLFVYTEVHLQTIVERIDTCLRQIVLNLFILVLAASSQ